MPLNLNQHSLNIVKHHLVFKTQHLDSLCIQKTVPLQITFLRTDKAMHLTIQLNGQSLLRAIKIKNVPAHAVLSSEFSAFELRTSDVRPQFYFGRGQMLA